MDEPFYEIGIRYDPVSKRIEMNSNCQDDVMAFGIIEAGRAAMIARQVQKEQPRVVVPMPIGSKF